MQARDIMITNVYTVKATDTLKDLLEIMVKNRIGGLPVVDDQGNLVGMVSDGDVLRFLAPKPFQIIDLYNAMYLEAETIEDVLQQKLDTPVKKIMTKRFILKLSPDEEFEKTIRLLSQHHYKKLPVVNEAGRVIGVISRGDLIFNISQKMIAQ
ncbi:CBS domain-containing protein [Oceanobacillus zhaokaii]|uniref:CBS domain-containing protein n=1 Tax=Oceanobacillus zhaokaii TaxID=2052660 RepID=A0A345PDY2_9BACI|nr:CBS domain-containing protein [Oceanobacillus zhaokaii]AXI08212.1 CBS domain-containing protein [Oceanobacillus zhaokaii]